ncbi:uncharacterized protein JCM15063_006496 [Sporobolomyces koalae]|uniref:uncharacterized protein n=1 Tax=Sporobolomyces koalae TaxID=500713 RepID=UPI00317BE095
MDYPTASSSRESLFRARSGPSSSVAERQFNSLASIPHATAIHSFATTPCCSHLYTGGQDGFVRRYALFPTVNPPPNLHTSSSTATAGSTSTSNGALASSTTTPFNLTMKQPTVEKLVDGTHSAQAGATPRLPVLSGYWENEEPPSLEPGSEVGNSNLAPPTGANTGPVKWGAKTVATGAQTPVYSLAVQSQELWGLSGTSKGSINLFTIRHDEGQIRHVFRPASTPALSESSSGHSPTAPVSVLTLDRTDEKSFLSGGWDGRIFDWDLDTGKVKRAFLSNGPNRQISSISYRPISTSSSPKHHLRSNGPTTTSIDEKSMDVDDDADADADGDADADADGELDADADGEVDDTFLTGTNGTAKLNPIGPDPASSVPLVDQKFHDELDSTTTGEEGGGQCFVSTSHDGMVMVWDKRLGSSRAVVKRFGDFGTELEQLQLVPKAKEGQDDERKGKARARDKSCTSACWSSDGNQLHVARHSSTFSTYDLRHSDPIATYALPTSSGPITSILALSNGTQVLTGSWDCVRLWDLNHARPASRDRAGGQSRNWNGSVESGSQSGVRIVAGAHYGGTLSHMHVDPLEKWLFTTSGTRGWQGNSTENLVINEIESLQQ